MDFEFTPDQLALRDAVSRICERYPDDYWLERDREGGFPSRCTPTWRATAGSASPCRRSTAAPAWA